MSSSSHGTISIPAISSPINLLCNMSNLISIKLDDTNYISWRYQVATMLEALNLFNYVNGGDLQKPDEFKIDENGVKSENLNPEFVKWNKTDKLLMTLLHSTLSAGALSHVIGSKNSRQVWIRLETRYAPVSKMSIAQLKADLYSIKKLTSESVDNYIERIKSIRDKLEIAAKYVSDEDILDLTSNGLPIDFHALKTSVRVATYFKPMSLVTLHELMRSEERSLNTIHQTINQNVCVPTTMNSVLSESRSLMLTGNQLHFNGFTGNQAESGQSSGVNTNSISGYQLSNSSGIHSGSNDNQSVVALENLAVNVRYDTNSGQYSGDNFNNRGLMSYIAQLPPLPSQPQPSVTHSSTPPQALMTMYETNPNQYFSSPSNYYPTYPMPQVSGSPSISPQYHHSSAYPSSAPTMTSMATPVYPNFVSATQPSTTIGGSSAYLATTSNPITNSLLDSMPQMVGPSTWISCK